MHADRPGGDGIDTGFALVLFARPVSGEGHVVVLVGPFTGDGIGVGILGVRSDGEGDAEVVFGGVLGENLARGNIPGLGIFFRTLFLSNRGLFTVVDGSLVTDGDSDGGLGDLAILHCGFDCPSGSGLAFNVTGVSIVPRGNASAEGHLVGGGDGLARTHVGVVIGGGNAGNSDAFTILRARNGLTGHFGLSGAIVLLLLGQIAGEGEGGGVDGDGDGAITHNGGIVLRRDLIPVLAALGHIDKRDFVPSLSARLGPGIIRLFDELNLSDLNLCACAVSGLGRPAVCYIVSFTSIGAGVTLCINNHFRRGDFQGGRIREFKFIVVIVPCGVCLQRSGDGVAAHGCVICIRSGIHRHIGIVHIAGL